MERSTIIAGAATVGGLLASVVMPGPMLLLGAAIGAGVGATSAALVTTAPPPRGPEPPEMGERQPVVVSADIPVVPIFSNVLTNLPTVRKSPMVILPTKVSTAVATSLHKQGITYENYQAKLLSAGLRVVEQTNWAQRVRLDRMYIPTTPYSGWIGALVAYGASQQTLFVKYLKKRYHNRFDGEWGKGYVDEGERAGLFSMTWQEDKHHGGRNRWRDVHAEWPAPCDSMGEVKWCHNLFKNYMKVQTILPGGRVLPAPEVPMQRTIQKHFVDNFMGKDKSSSEYGHWRESDFKDFQIDKRLPGGEHYNWIMAHKGALREPVNKLGKAFPHYMHDVSDYYNIGYWLVWAAECWRVNAVPARPNLSDPQTKLALNPPKEWVRHCLAWGVGVATPNRILNRKRTREYDPPLVPIGPEGLTKNISGLYYKVMQATPVPGSIPSGWELSGRKILKWPMVGEAAVFRPTWEWPGGETAWDKYIDATRIDKFFSDPQFQIALISIDLVSSIMSSVTAGAIGGAVTAVVSSITSGAVLAAINALRAFATSGFEFTSETLLSALSAIAQGSGIKGLDNTATVDWVKDRINDIDKYWGYADELIGDYQIIRDVQENYERSVERITSF